MKKFFYILLPISLLLCGCDKNKSSTTNGSIALIDSTEFFLQLANSDTIAPKKRLLYSQRLYKQLIDEPNDSLNRINLFKVANRFYNLNDLYQYKQVSSDILERALSEKDTLSIAKAHIYLGDYYKSTTVKDSALYNYVRAEKIYQVLRDNKNLAQVKISQAEVQWHENDYFASESSALEALKYLRNSNDLEKEHEALVLLGIICNAQKDYKNALQYLNRALEIAQNNSLQSATPTATTLNNIGNVYQVSNNNELAIQNFERALETKNLHQENPTLYSILLDNLAYSKFKIGQTDREIEKLFLKSIEIKDSLKNYSGVSFSQARLGEFYYSRGKIDTALKITRQALENADKSGSAINKLLPLKQLSSYDIPESKIYSDLYIKINDSVQLAERAIQDKFARIQFETDEISLQKDKLAEQNRNLLLFFVGTVMIGLLLFVIRTQRAKNRELMLKQAQQKANEDIYNLMLSQQNKIEEGRIREKKRIAQELHDGVLSRLFGARLNLDSLNKMDGDEAMEKRNNYLTELKNIEQDLRDISHDLNREKFVLINNFLAIFNDLLEEQAANFDPQVESNIDEGIPWEKISNTLKINLYRIVQETLQNINKYAKATKIKIDLTARDATLYLEVSDNGRGFSVDRKSKGIGLQNILSRTEECDGQLDIKSKKGKGTTISIAFPTENKSNSEPPLANIQPIIA